MDRAGFWPSSLRRSFNRGIGRREDDDAREHPRTLDEVGCAFNVTRERIRQIEHQSLKKLQNLHEADKLRDHVAFRTSTVGTMPATDPLQLKEYLRAHGVSFDVIEHTRSESAPAEAEAVHMPAEQTAKTVVLRTPSGYRFAIISASDRLDLHKAAAALEVSRHELRFATEADMAADFPAYEVGAIPPIGPDTPAGLIDLRLLDYQRVVCPAGDHEHSLLVDPLDIVRITGARTQDLRAD